MTEGNDPAVEPRQADLAAQNIRSVRLGISSEIDDRPPGSNHAGHLAERTLGVVEVVEAADAQHGVEPAVAERQVLGLAEDQRQVARPARCRQAASWTVEMSMPTIDQSRGSQSR